MADDKKTEVVKKSPIHLYRDKLRQGETLKDTVLEGLKSTNARVRSLATKMAFKIADKELIKNSVLPLINSDKSKKVLRTLSSKITRKSLIKKVQTLLAKKKMEKSAKTPEETAAGPKA